MIIFFILKSQMYDIKCDSQQLFSKYFTLYSIGLVRTNGDRYFSFFKVFWFMAEELSLRWVTCSFSLENVHKSYNRTLCIVLEIWHVGSNTSADKQYLLYMWWLPINTEITVSWQYFSSPAICRPLNTSLTTYKHSEKIKYCAQAFNITGKILSLIQLFFSSSSPISSPDFGRRLCECVCVDLIKVLIIGVFGEQTRGQMNGGHM